VADNAVHTLLREQRSVLLGGEEARNDGVDPDAIVCQFAR